MPRSGSFQDTMSRGGPHSGGDLELEKDFDSDRRVIGNNQLLCKGKLVTGPDGKSGIGSFLFILVPGLLFQIYPGAYFWANYTAGIPLFAALLNILSLIWLVTTVFSDPGIMPRQPDYRDRFDPATQSLRVKQPPRFQDVVLHGYPIRLKFCATCNIYRPPRCTHCSVCDNCVERFDHHCPWVGNCIGKRNYWLFYSFVTTTGTLTVFCFCLSTAHVGLLGRDALEKHTTWGTADGVWWAILEAPMSAFLAIYTFAFALFTLGLCLYHSHLVVTNQTTYEQIKGTYSEPGNPFHRGPWQNCRSILFSEVRPQYFNPLNGQAVLRPRPHGGEDPRELEIEMKGVLS